MTKHMLLFFLEIFSTGKQFRKDIVPERGNQLLNMYPFLPIMYQFLPNNVH